MNDDEPTQADQAFTAFLRACDRRHVELDRIAHASDIELRMIWAAA